MRRVYAAGETLVDIIFKGDQPVTARPGGSMLNSSVSMGRAGLNVVFISSVGNDRVGKYVSKFIAENSIALDHLFTYTGQTPVALAFLDSNNNAVYSFYRPCQEITYQKADIIFAGIDILLTGGYYSVRRESREQVRHLLENAEKAGAMIIYDPNYRKPHLDKLNDVFAGILENIAYADIIRGSDEDFFNLFGKRNVDDVFDVISAHSDAVLIYTRGREGVTVKSRKLSVDFPVPRVDTLSTIGAGDSFNAGIIYGLISNKITGNELRSIKAETWHDVVEVAVMFAASVCLSFDNYISESLGSTFKAALYNDKN